MNRKAGLAGAGQSGAEWDRERWEGEVGQSSWRALDPVGHIYTRVSVPMYCEQCMTFALASKSLQVLANLKVWISRAIPRGRAARE